MLRPNGAPMAAEHATATTTASVTDWTGPNRTRPDRAGLSGPQRTHRDTTGSAIATSCQPEDIETYAGTPYKNNTVAKYPHANSRIENLRTKTYEKWVPNLHRYHHRQLSTTMLTLVATLTGALLWPTLRTHLSQLQPMSTTELPRPPPRPDSSQLGQIQIV